MLGSNSPTISDTFVLWLVENKVRKHYTMQAFPPTPAKELAPFSQPSYIYRGCFSNNSPRLIKWLISAAQVEYSLEQMSDYGNLLGVCKREGDNMPTYRTEWILPSVGKEHLQSNPLSFDDKSDLKILFQSHSIEAR